MHRMFQEALKHLKSQGYPPWETKKLKHTIRRCHGYEKFLLPTDVNLLFNGNKLRSELYDRKVNFCIEY